MAFEYILVIIIAICLILIWYVSVYNNYQNYIIRINEAEAFIDTTLRKRFDLLNKSIEIIKANTKETEVLNIIDELKTMKISNFDLDRKLYDAINEFNKYRKYYNDIITDYNKLVKKFPSNIVAKVSRYKTRTYFDGKDMEDDDTKDFKL